MNPITQQITEVELKDGTRIFIAPTGAKNIVTIEGSVRGGWSMLARSKAEAALIAAELLDSGTSTKSKDGIHEALGKRGASLSFKDGADRTFFSGSCFPEDLLFLLSLISECLADAIIPAPDVISAKTRALGDLEESATDTRTQAAGALSRLLYDKTHVNYMETTKNRIQNLTAIARADVVSFRKSLSREGLVVAIVGDLETSKARTAAEKAFKTLPKGVGISLEERIHQGTYIVSETLVPINDKANIDTYFGTTIPFTYDSPEYLPFVTLSSMLGGRGLSSGHLMRTIRERDGYTYGIYAQQVGFLEKTQGAFRIWATFSPATFTEAVAATKKEITVFLKKGMTEDALSLKKDEMIGNYLIGLSTTRGLAGMLHTIGVEGKPLSYIDAYPSLIRAITLSEVQNLSPLLAPENLSLAASGTFPKQ